MTNPFIADRLVKDVQASRVFSEYRALIGSPPSLNQLDKWLDDFDVSTILTAVEALARKLEQGVKMDSYQQARYVAKILESHAKASQK